VYARLSLSLKLNIFITLRMMINILLKKISRNRVSVLPGKDDMEGADEATTSLTRTPTIAGKNRVKHLCVVRYCYYRSQPG
jgi:hypothetical protein